MYNHNKFSLATKTQQCTAGSNTHWCEYLLRRADGLTDAYEKLESYNQVLTIDIRLQLMPPAYQL